MTGLEAIERIKKSHYTAIAVMGCERDSETEKAIEIVEKEHKALEIIKEKYVNVDLLWDVSSLEEYNSEIMFSYQIITEEEFNLLREVLK